MSGINKKENQEKPSLGHAERGASTQKDSENFEEQHSSEWKEYLEQEDERKIREWNRSKNTSKNLRETRKSSEPEEFHTQNDIEADRTPKESGGKKMFLTAGITALVVLAAGGIFWAGMKFQKNRQDPAPEQISIAADDAQENSTENEEESIQTQTAEEVPIPEEAVEEVLENDSAVPTTSAETVPVSFPAGQYQVGDIVRLGQYEQDGNSENGKETIEWQVVSVERNRMLLLSRYVIDAKPFQDSADDMELSEVTWETCSLREWLNNEFFYFSFSNEERKVIAKSPVLADINPDFAGDQGGNVQDRVFLLSVKEAKDFFDNNEDRACESTEYAKMKGLELSKQSETFLWWLRTIYYENASEVLSSGIISTKGEHFENESRGVRPALWVNLTFK